MDNTFANKNKSSAISVLICVYNAQHYIRRTIECISQICIKKYQSYEIVIVDDCSSDNTVKSLSVIKDSNIKIYRNNASVGLEKAYQIGSKFCKNTDIIHFNADSRAILTVATQNKQLEPVIVKEKIQTVTSQTKNDIIVSVILITQNKLELLEKALESFADQACDKNLYEIIVVDNGSFAKADLTVNKYRNKMNIVYLYKDNAGIASARNEGIKCANGQIILFTDDTKAAGKELINAHIQIHCDNRYDEVAVVGQLEWHKDLQSDLFMQFLDNREQEFTGCNKLKNGYSYDLWEWGNYQISIKKALLCSLEYAFDANIKSGYEDVEVVCRLLKGGKKMRVIHNSCAVGYILERPNYEEICLVRYSKGADLRYVWNKFKDMVSARYKLENAAGEYEAKYSANLEQWFGRIKDFNAKIAKLAPDNQKIDANSQIAVFKLYEESLKGYLLKGFSEQTKTTMIINKQLQPANLPEAKNVRKSILFFSPQVPLYDKGSSHFRVYNILKILANNGYSIEYVYHSQSGNMPKYTNGFNGMVKFVHIPLEQKALNNYIKSKDKNTVGWVWITNIWNGSNMQSAEQLIDICRENLPQTKVVIDVMDFLSRKAARVYEYSKDPMEQFRSKSYFEMEKRLYPKADKVVVVTKSESKAISDVIQCDVQVVSNIHPITDYIVSLNQRKNICFIGSLGLNHNYNAIKWFAENVWGKIIAANPAVEFHILGGGNEKFKDEFNCYPNIKIVGFVEDAEMAISQYRVFACPMVFGSGMKGKLGSSAIAGTPIVSTSVGTESMEFVNGQNCFIADEPDLFAKKCAQLLQDNDTWQKFSTNAKNMIIQNYSPDAVSAMIDKVLEDSTATGVEPNLTDKVQEPTFTFVMIVLNGMPFIEFSIKSIYDFAKEIIIVEGAVEKCLFAANSDGSSKDGTVEFIRSFPDPKNKIKLVQGRWPEKCEMQNEALKYASGDFVWLIDSDEIYSQADLLKVREILDKDREITQINLIPDNFWKGFDYIFESKMFYDISGYHYKRIFKFATGAKFISHRPPTMVLPDSDKTTEQMKVLDGWTSRKMGIKMYHYSYVLPEQVMQKIELYRRYGWEKGWKIDIEQWFKECYIKWTPQNRKEIEQNWPVWTGDRQSYTLPFAGQHPEVIRDFIEKFNGNKALISALPQSKKLKVAEDYVKSGIAVDTESTFGQSIKEVFSQIRPQKIIECGTYRGTGTTTIIANTLQEIGINDYVFCTIEVNPQNYQLAVEYFKNNNINVKALNGLSLPRHLLPSAGQIEDDTIKNVVGDDIFVDHQESRRVQRYLQETDFPNVPDDLLGKCLAVMKNRPDFVLLDSGAHIGFTEFRYLIDKLQGECFIALDDIYHIKHYRSFQFIKADNRFEIVKESKEKFGYCIVKFTPVICFDKNNSIDRKYRPKDSIKTKYADEEKSLNVIGSSYYLKKTLEAWKNIEIDKPVQSRANKMQRHIDNKTPFWNIHTALAFIADKLSPQNYLEVGVRSGCSLVQVLNNSEVKNVTAIDIWDGQYSGLSNTLEYTKSQFEKYQVKTGRRFNIDFIHGNSHTELKKLIQKGLKFDLITVDGDHKKAGTWQDLQEAAELLGDKGAIVFDDIIHPDFKSLRDLVDDFINKYPQYSVIINQQQDNGCVILVKNIDIEKLLENNESKLLNLENNQKVLLIRTDSLGDFIIFTDVLPYYRKLFPDAKIDIAVRNGTEQLAQLCSELNSVITHDRKKMVYDEKYALDFISKIRAEKYDVVINTLYSRDKVSDFIAINSGAKQIIGSLGDTTNISQQQLNENSKHYTKLLTMLSEPKIETQRNREFLKCLGIEPVGKVCTNITIQQSDMSFAEQFYQNNAISDAIILAPFGQFDFRTWQIDNWIKLLQMYQGQTFIITGVSGDYDKAEEIISRLNGVKIYNLCGKTTVPQLTALIAKSKLCITAESAPAHIAAAVTVKHIVLIGGGHFGRFMPYSDDTILVYNKIDCYNCNWICKDKKYECIQSITVNQVAQKVNQVLQLSSTAKTESSYLVSAIVSTYNSEKYFKGCLDDLIAQTLYQKGQLEIIVVNSNSQQNEEAIIQPYLENYQNIKYIKTPQRETIYKAWNRAIKAANGKYITNANTDDRHNHEAIETLANVLDVNPSKAVAYANQQLYCYDQDGKEIVTGVRVGAPFNRQLLFDGKCPPGSQPMWRASLHNEFGLFDDTFIVGGDTEFWFRVSQKYDFEFISEILGKRYNSDEVVSKSSKDLSRYEGSAILQCYDYAAATKKIIYSPITQTEPFCNWAEIKMLRDRQKAKITGKEPTLAEHIKVLDNRKSENPAVSVLVVADVNDSKYQQTIDSINRQTFKDYEIIAVSVDNIINFENACNIIFDCNMGKGYIRKTASTFAKGSYLVFVDSGTILNQNCLERTVHHFQSDDIIGLRGKIIPQKGIVSEGFDLGSERIESLCSIDIFAAFKRDVYDQAGGYAPEFTAINTPELLYRIYKKINSNKFYYYPDVIVGKHIFLTDPAEEKFRQEYMHYLAWKKDRDITLFCEGGYLNLKPKDIEQDQKDKEFLVSAIVSTYNSEKFIKGCLDDLIEQSLYRVGQLEIVIVNSGSQQNEDAIIQEYKDKYKNITYLKTDNREGLYTAWNRAIKLARGKYITNANTDDRHHNDCMKILAEALDKNPDAVLAYSDQIITDTENAILDKCNVVEYAKRPDFTRQRLLLGCCVGSQPMWRKSVHNEFGYFDESLSCAADWDFWCKISEKYKFIHIPQFLGLYLKNEDGIENGKKIHSLYERYSVGKRYGTEYISVILYHTPSETDSLVSIIMPAYNSSKYIAESIESVLIQNYPKFELIIVDDGSTDDTAKIVQSFNDQRVKLIQTENKGASSARNTAIKNATGVFIVPLDSDDMMSPDFILEHLKTFQANPQAALVYCDDMLIDENSKPINIMNKPEYGSSQELIRDMFRLGHAPVNFRTMIKKCVLDKIGLYDTGLIIGEDYDMMRRFIKLGFEIKHLALPCIFRRMQADSLSRTPARAKAVSHFDVVQRVADTFECRQLFPDVDWKSIPNRQWDMHSDVLKGATWFGIAARYAETNQAVMAAVAFEKAQKSLEDCNKLQPDNIAIKQLLEKFENYRKQLSSASL